MPNKAGLRDALIEAHAQGFATPDEARTASRIAELEAENTMLRDALAWYGEQARLCRLIHSEGDAGRQALAADGGKRAQAELSRARASGVPVDVVGGERG